MISLADRFVCRFLFFNSTSFDFVSETVAAARLPHSVRLMWMASAVSKGRVDDTFAAAFISRAAVPRLLNPSAAALARSQGTHRP